MGLKQLLTNLEGEGTLDAYPNHNTPEDTGGFNYGNSTSIFDTKIFNQKSFKFGEGTAYDKPNEGYSNEPFIKKTLDLTIGGGGATNFVDSFTDGLIRGGAVTHLERQLTDAARIGKFLITGKGIAFITKQVGLQLSNPKIREGTLTNPAKSNSRTYNLGVNTLAQVAASGTGLHVKREGLLPTSFDGYIDDLDKTRATDNNNRLIQFFEEKIAPDTTIKPPTTNQPESTPESGNIFNQIGNAVNSFLGIPDKPETLYSYTGGPGSLYGIGNTTIRRYINTNQGAIKRDKFIFKDIIVQDNGFPIVTHFNITKDNINFLGPDLTLKAFYEGNNEFGEVNLSTEEEQEAMDVGVPLKEDKVFTAKRIKEGPAHERFNRLQTSDSPSIQNYLKIIGRPGFDYQKQTDFNKKFIREERINTGNPGAREDDPHLKFNTKEGESAYNVYSSKKIDMVNMFDIYQTRGGFDIPEVRDLIRFRFEAVDSDDPQLSNTMVFRAFLDQFSDNFTGNYNSFSYNGRGETFYTYNNFKREINFNFKIAAQTRHEMMPLYRKLNYLASNTAPEYSNMGRIRTPFMRLTVGSWCDRLPGIMTSVGISWKTNYPWEISIDSPEGGQDNHMLVLPHILDVKVNYTPIHDFLPEKGISSPFILPHPRNRVPEQKWLLPDVATTTEQAIKLGLDKINEKEEIRTQSFPVNHTDYPASEQENNTNNPDATTAGNAGS